MHFGRLCLVTASGGALELFDFTIFLLMSRYISAAFFPGSDPLAGQLYVALLFFTGYVARPVGGVIAGHLGDRYGRKLLFLWTIGLMSLATLLIGLLPGYSQWGMTSVILLMTLRMIQGFSLGGELPGSTTYAAEHVPFSRRGMVTGIIIASVTFGNVIGSSLAWLLTSQLTESQMLEWGWRLPFLMGGLAGMFGLMGRRNLKETPVFEKLLESRQQARIPARVLLNNHWKEALSGVLMASVTATTVSVFLYLPSYLKLSGLATSVSSFQLTTGAFLLYSGVTVLFGRLSDFVCRKQQMMVGAVLLALVVMMVSWYQAHHPYSIFWPVIITAFTAAIINGAYEVAIIELYPTSVRYSGVAFSHNLGFVIFGGLTPVVLTGLEQAGLRVFPLIILVPVALLVLAASYKRPGRSSQSLEYL